MTSTASPPPSAIAITSLYDVPTTRLKNHGTSCFMSSVIFTLYATRPFRNAVMHLMDDSVNELASALKKLFLLMRQKHTITGSAQLSKKLLFATETRFREGFHDANDFLIFILQDEVGFDDPTYPVLPNIIKTLFTGQINAMKICTNTSCKLETDSTSSFVEYELPVLDGLSLTDLLGRG